MLQNADSFQISDEELVSSEDEVAISQGLKESLNGQGRPFEEFAGEFEAKHGLENRDSTSEHDKFRNRNI